MADAIGSFTFTTLTGEIPVSKGQNKDISWDGAQGIAYRVMPAKSNIGILESLAFWPNDLGQAASAAEQHASYINTLQEITIGGLGTFTGMFIIDVITPIPKLVYSSTGLWLWRTPATWKVRATG
jgi:hypothetical protein